MAIIGATSGLVPLHEFINGMQRVAQAVVGIRAGEYALATGFVIAPRLIVTVAYAFSRSLVGGPIFAELVGMAEELIRLELDQSPELLGSPMGGLNRFPPVALLRLIGDRELTPVELAPGEVPLGDAIYIVHGAGFGRGKLSVSAGRTIGLKTGYAGGPNNDLDGDAFVTYDADTLPGSGGAPVLDMTSRLVAMHALAVQANKQNAGIKRSVLVDALSQSRSWSEIASHQGLADIASARRQLAVAASAEPPTLAELAAWQVHAALTPMIDPAAVDADRKQWLRARCDVVDYVDDDGEDVERWAMRVEERQRVCERAGSLTRLRELYSDNGKSSSPADAVLRTIFNGPPYHLSEQAETALGWWSQVVNWLRTVAPELPSPAEIARALEYTHFENTLRSVAKPDFHGRKDVLEKLARWYDSDEGPLVLVGIGGIGKSAIMAKFALTLPGNPLLLWLDFDRPDLAPDNAYSIIAAVQRLALLRLDLPKLGIDGNDWKGSADALGEALARALEEAGLAAPPLMVLDSFEAAQYSERYQELWPVIDRLAYHLPRLRVCVTGRAPVEKLVVSGKPAQAVRVGPMSDTDAELYLKARGVADPQIISHSIELAYGVPLNLQLAARVIEMGGTVSDIPAKVEESLVAGFLQRRILGRLRNRNYTELAEGAIVLRCLTADMIDPVLGPHLKKLPAGDATLWFRELGRELGLVEPGATLRVRPEVRRATLALLEKDRPDWVRAIDRSAEHWYAGLSDPASWQRAELVYYRLRLGNLDGADTVWRDACAELLNDVACGELTLAAAEWLGARLRLLPSARLGQLEFRDLGEAPGQDKVSPVNDDETWEVDAIRRILDARGRGLERIIPEISKERARRTPNSPLIFHEAFSLRERGYPDQARSLLRSAGNGEGFVARDRQALAALIARDVGDRPEADRLLESLGRTEQWEDRAEPHLFALGAAAARVCLCVDFDAEIELARTAPGDAWPPIGVLLARADALLPALRAKLPDQEAGAGLESAVVQVDASKGTWHAGVSQVRESWNRAHPHWIAEFSDYEATWRRTGRWDYAFDLHLADTPHLRLAATLAELAWRRSFLIAENIFPLSSIEECVIARTALRLTAALVGSVALFARRLGDVEITLGSQTLADAVRSAPAVAAHLPLSVPAWEIARGRLERGVDAAHDWRAYARPAGEDTVLVLGRDLVSYRGPPSLDPEGMTGAMIFALVAPDPLTTLVEELAGVPDRVAQASEAQKLGAVQNKSHSRKRDILKEAWHKLTKSSADDEDPHKGKFGGQSKNGWAEIQARVKQFGHKRFSISLTIRALNEAARAALAGKIAKIFLHPTFAQDVQTQVFDSGGTIRLPLIAYGAFTVGVKLPDNLGMLELDLAEIDDAREDFRRS